MRSRVRALVVHVAVVSLIIVCGARPAEPLDLKSVLTGYAVTGWTVRDGLPAGGVWAIAQDGDGYLWVGSDVGLLRFDGVRFATAQSLGHKGMPPSPARALLISRRTGSLWVGLGNGEGVYEVRPVPGSTPAFRDLRGSVSALAEDPSGAIWAATDTGLYRYDGTRWTRAILPGTDASRNVFSVYVNAKGSVWAGTPTGLFERVTGEDFHLIDSFRTEVRGIAEDAQGRVWVADPIFGLRRAAETQPAWTTNQGAGWTLFRDRTGNMWVPTRGQGLWRIRTATGTSALSVLETSTSETGLVDDAVSAITEDREGNIWVGTQQGLNRFTPHTVTSIDGLGLYRMMEAAAEGGVWVGTINGLARFANGHAVPTVASGEPISVVRAIFRDKHDTVWLSSARGLGKLVNGRFIPFSLGGGGPFRIRSIAGSGSEGLWLVDLSEGLLRWNDGHLTRVALPAGWLSTDVEFVYSDTSDRTWIAFRDGRLGLFESSGEFRPFGAADGWAPGTHKTLYAIADGEKGSVWVIGSGGLSRFSNGRLATLGPTNGLPGTTATGIRVDDLGYLWLVLDTGVVRFHTTEFENAIASPRYRIRYRRFDSSNGLAAVLLPSGNRGTARSKDGSLWFATGRGVAVIDPHAIEEQRPEEDLSLQIDRAVVNDEQESIQTRATLPATTERLRIDYTAPQLSSRNLRFRYRLVGVDPDWIEAGNRRQAFYTNLTPGSYRFLVQAERVDGPGDDQVSWDFAIQPAFYQTRWFFVGCIAALLAGVWVTWQFYLRRVRREFALVLAERARMSREIHDTLLQNLAGLAIRCAGISNTLEPESSARTQLVAIRQQMESYLRDVRQAIWDLRAPVLETCDVASALAAFGRDATATSDVRFELSVRGKPHRVSGKVENEILRIGQEAIANALKHAHARHVTLELQFEREALTLRVVDDGSGFEMPRRVGDGKGHFGLLGMKERAQEVGGVLRIARRSTGGTEVEVVVPLTAQAATL